MFSRYHAAIPSACSAPADVTSFCLPAFLQIFRITYPYQEDMHGWEDEELTAAAAGSLLPLQPELMQQLFPYHFLMDYDGNVMQVSRAACFHILLLCCLML